MLSGCNKLLSNAKLCAILINILHLGIRYQANGQLTARLV